LDTFLQQGDEEEIEGLTNSFDDEEAASMTPLDNLTVKLQEIRRRYYSVSMCRVNPKGAGFTRIRAPEVEPSMGPNPVKPTPEGFTWHKDCCPFYFIFIFFPSYQVSPGKKTTVGVSKNRMPASAGVLFFQMPLGFSHSIMVSANAL
jgi:hypothetical protein